MRQALIGVRHGALLRCALIKPPEENSSPGSLKALHVSLVKPVAYLKDRVTKTSMRTRSVGLRSPRRPLVATQQHVEIRERLFLRGRGGKKRYEPRRCSGSLLCPIPQGYCWPTKPARFPAGAGSGTKIRC